MRPPALGVGTVLAAAFHALPRLNPEEKYSVTPKSGLFLAGSCVAAIAAVGSIFELSSGSPDWGSGPTTLILGICVPLVGLLFYAAVKDANANQQ
jgi:hypothetical protein